MVQMPGTSSGFFDYCHCAFHNRDRYERWQNIDLKAIATEEILGSEAKSFVISEESLSVPDRKIPEKLEFLKNLGQAKIVMCVRRQDKFLQSLYLQFIKENGRKISQTFQEFIKDPKIVKLATFDETLDFWAGVFGKENIIVLDFDILKERQNFISSMVQIFGVVPNFEFAEVRQNQSISYEKAEIIRRFSQMYPRVNRHRLTHALNKLNLDQNLERYEPPQVSRIASHYRASNERLRERYGVDLLAYGSPMDMRMNRKANLSENIQFEKSINRIFMRLVKDAHQGGNWDFI
ncbi:hypothetical protein SAMN04488056_108194 [Cohaesibacter marisflavi]|uniref:Sulfotransferase domain-containing protein n=1 Tax=Cohaesibacter marisflavi TaxID=655353 RepID=A0A1I5ICX0_9HYPH|nr:hypothetical protein [Cohaesibacter marisflavi]SFO58435.1 hypothetical protein SAMN04488056_108194 [Cohaesibacter marisflavi]